MNFHFTIDQLGDSAVVIKWEQRIDPAVHGAVMQTYRGLQAASSLYIRDLIPAYASLTVVYDAVLIRRRERRTAAEWIKSFISTVMTGAQESSIANARTLEIPVCYDPSLGWDIEEMARVRNVSPEDIATWHSQLTYTVYMIGFLPGFPYMGAVCEELVTPRLKQPRMQVPAGSVGIAGAQTGVYTLQSPGGWNIIGRTPLRMFEAEREEPCYCRPGDQIKFVPVSLNTFQQLQQEK
ncbi:MAG TPA: 5-oxoprolinase subunit PxpB [Chitinophaga sp.]|uniref:5-oxoprolinase subunit PxpB n=1 Tax=Chitinophaga sp. TaxID=1869181 RepID=UPI002B98D3B3|nr:5-oxoprolinase subunit PxpB [Chitinophaga sp.]HVI47836.1 5-oxoprolinase subunit PxpB [Chitinophaga sp.]